MSRGLRACVVFAISGTAAAAMLILAAVPSHSGIKEGKLVAPRPPIQVGFEGPNVTISFPPGLAPFEVGPGAEGTTISFPGEPPIQLPGPGDSVTIDFPRAGTITIPLDRKRVVRVTGVSANSPSVRKHIGGSK